MASVCSLSEATSPRPLHVRWLGRVAYRDAHALQTGLFTEHLDRALEAWEDLDVGAVVLNDTPTYRIDHMPYGGVKDSGLGREGLRWAIEDMTELRIMVLAQPA